jgi:hypothetical protein
LSTGLFGSGGGVEREREMGPKKGEGAGMASGADAHISIVDNHARFKSNGCVLVVLENYWPEGKRLPTSITWPSTHAV